MAIYVLLQCCKCNRSIKLHLYSFSKNKYGVYVSLCEHFNIIYSFTTNYKFFSLGWRIVLEVKVQCRKCSRKYFNFGTQSFNSENYNLDIYHTCCYNVFIFSVDGKKFSSDGAGFLLQKKLKEKEEKFRAEQDKKMEEEEKFKNNEIINFDMDYIDEEYEELIIKENNKIANVLNFDILEEIEKHTNFQISKVSLS